MENIIVKPSNLWDFYQEHKDNMSSTDYKIATNEDYGCEVFLTENGDAKPMIVVEMDGIDVYEEEIVSQKDAADTYDYVRDYYLSDNSVSAVSKDEEDDEQQCTETAMRDREFDIDICLDNFLCDLIGTDNAADLKNYDEIIEDCKEHFLEYLARKHKVKIYRPMYLEYDGGLRVLESYPYENMEFEDENNPIYK